MKFSILICSRNSQKYLIKILESIVQLEEKSLLKKILLVDYFSEDKTQEIFSHFIKKNSLDGLILKITEAGKSRALEKGLDLLADDNLSYAIIQDTDNALDKNFLKNLQKKTELYPNTAIFGSRGISYSKKAEFLIYKKFPEYLNSFAIGHQYPRDGDIHYFNNKFGLWGACSVINLNHWKYIRQNGFKFILNATRHNGVFPNYYFAGGEDTELAIWFQIAGFQCKYFSDLIFYHIIDFDRISFKFILDFYKKSIFSNFVLKMLIYNLYKIRPQKHYKYFLFKNIYLSVLHEFLILVKSFFSLKKKYFFNILIHFNRFFNSFVFLFKNANQLSKLNKTINANSNIYF